MAVNPFDFVKSINEKKQVDNPAQYNPFIANLAFSQTMDTVLLANEMNVRHQLPPEAQYDFLYGSISKRRRWGKWYKGDENPHLHMVMEFYGYSEQKALEALQLLTQENIRDIQIQMERGGR